MLSDIISTGLQDDQDKRLERNNLDKNKSPHLLARALDPALALNSSMSKSKKCPSYFYPEPNGDGVMERQANPVLQHAITPLAIHTCPKTVSFSNP